ncbi:MAG TPA: NUDIX domain-containing protein [Candidatus Saccharimonadia bacterium]|jgi:8-oxo-dGTP pyrophosphatase MutT (NUDIX family)
MQQKARSAVLIIKDDMLLLIERTRTPEPMYYVLPGGGVEEGETPEQAAIREMKEELGVDITVENKEKDLSQTARETWIVRASLDESAEPVWMEEHKQTSANSYKVVWLPITQLKGALVYPKGTVSFIK